MPNVDAVSAETSPAHACEWCGRGAIVFAVWSELSGELYWSCVEYVCLDALGALCGACDVWITTVDVTDPSDVSRAITDTRANARRRR